MPVPCPVNSMGTDLTAGCQCIPGYSGAVTATNESPFYINQCVVACPPFSTGAHVATGCTCVPGYVGTIAFAATYPYFTGSCTGMRRFNDYRRVWAH